MEEVFGRRQDGLVSRINGYRSMVMASGGISQQEEKSMTDSGGCPGGGKTLIDGFLEGTVERIPVDSQLKKVEYLNRDRLQDIYSGQMVSAGYSQARWVSAGSPPGMPELSDYFFALTSSTTSISKSSGVYPGMTVI